MRKPFPLTAASQWPRKVALWLYYELCESKTAPEEKILYHRMAIKNYVHPWCDVTTFHKNKAE